MKIGKLSKITNGIKKRSKKSPLVFGVSFFFIILSSVITIIEGGGKLKVYYESTIGYKSSLYKKINLLTTDTQINYFNDILGTALIKNIKEKYNEYIYINKYFYTQAITNKNDQIIAYNITTRDKSFNPLIFNKIECKDTKGLKFGNMVMYSKQISSKKCKKIIPIKLGKNTFSEATSNEFGFPERIDSGLGFRRMYYFEVYYLGNPGLYQNYIFGINDAGYIKIGDIDEYTFNKEIDINSPIIKKFRDNSVINMFGKISPNFDLHDENILFGPDLDQVRLLSI